MSSRRALSLWLALLAPSLYACGDNETGDQPDAAVTEDPDAEPPDDPDAAPPAGACAELENPAGSIAVPGKFSGSVAGAGADLVAGEGVCDVEGDPANPSWYALEGEDAVIALTGLEVGGHYLVTLGATEDLGFYVITGCDEESGGPGAGQCSLFDDRSTTGEQNAFDATGTEAWIVVDNGEFDGPPDPGEFDLDVTEVDCITDAHCEGNPSGPACAEYACVECVSPIQCTDPAEPVCGGDNTCTAGPNECTGDDENDTTGDGDDGPAAATAITAPTSGDPVEIDGAICSLPGAELDFYAVELAAGDYGFDLTWEGEYDLDFGLMNSSGTYVAASAAESVFSPEGFQYTVTTAGTYYLVVDLYAPADQAAAVPYELTVAVPSCQTNDDCTLPTAPVCSAGGTCGPGPALCEDDDLGDAGGGDDVSSAARPFVLVLDDTAVSQTGAICTTPGELDWYSVTVPAGHGVELSLAWDGADDLDLRVFDSEDRLMGLAWYSSPENVTLTYLPAGTYYVEVSKFAEATTASTPYTLSATRTATAACTAASDCDDEYVTQIYRGDCTAGVCQFIAPGDRAAGAACDSGDDCAGDSCTYFAFEADAAESICATSCTDQAGCAGVAGTTCFVEAELCVPSCAADVECGANTQSFEVDADLPWDYFLCTEATGVCSVEQ